MLALEQYKSSLLALEAEGHKLLHSYKGDGQELKLKWHEETALATTDILEQHDFV